MKRYFVIATKWDAEKKAQIKFVAGEFTEYHYAAIFKSAYIKLYNAHADIVEEYELLNK